MMPFHTSFYQPRVPFLATGTYFLATNPSFEAAHPTFGHPFFFLKKLSLFQPSVCLFFINLFLILEIHPSSLSNNPFLAFQPNFLSYPSYFSQSIRISMSDPFLAIRISLLLTPPLVLAICPSLISHPSLVQQPNFKVSHLSYLKLPIRAFPLASRNPSPLVSIPLNFLIIIHEKLGILCLLSTKLLSLHPS